MSRWVFLFLAVILATARPDFGFAEDERGLLEAFDAHELLHAEASLLQTALIATGDYSGDTRGVWDSGGQQAFEAYAAREFQQAPLNLHAAALMIGFADTIAMNGWAQSSDPDTGLSFALPLADLKRRTTGDGAEWINSDGGLSILATRQSRAETTAAHFAVAITQGKTGEAKILREPAHWTTLSISDGGLRIFQASDLVQGEWSSLRIISTPAHDLEANLIAASMTPGQATSWDLPAGGLLENLVGDTYAYLTQSKGETRPVSIAAAPVEAETSTGTGFYLGPLLLVTASHVVADCKRVTFVDGTPLKVIAEDADLDLAAIRVPEPANHWLRLGTERALGLGQRVNAVGYPYFGLSGTGLNVTGGNISALAGLDDDKRFLSVTAPVQPGNSGGPLLAGDGAVAGVVVARLSEDYISKTTGSLPQNVNFAVQSHELASFLKSNHLTPKTGGMAPFDMDDGAPSEIVETVVPIVCD